MGGCATCLSGVRCGRLPWPLGARLVALFVLLCAVFTPHEVCAEDVRVPITLQAELLSKVAAYDRNMPARAGDRVRVLLVQKPGNDDSSRTVAQMQSALSQISTIAGLPHDEVLVSWSGAAALAQAVKTQHASIVFFTPGMADDLEAIRNALDGLDVLSVAAVADYVPGGIVLGFDLVESKPKLSVNLKQARKQNVAFKAEVLKIMKVYQ
jgi:hypothetical protein